MNFRPCIDLHQGLVKQIVGGTLNDFSRPLVENFVSRRDPAFFAELFKEDGLTGGHIIMLGPGNEAAALKALRAYPGGFQIGGGITPDNAGYFLEQGASRVIVTSYVFRDGVINYHNLERLATAVGKDRLVLDLSCRKRADTYFVVTDKWQKFTNVEINPGNLLELAGYCAEFLIHAADVEGLCRGIETDLVKRLGQWVSIPTTYAGGVRSLSDLDLVKNLGLGKLDITVGSALDIFGGNLPYAEVIKWHNRNH
ncbi:MAG: phosphoribosylformimino-5-aminoimidazole carboxamide ribotide isomerase [Bacillota bacterium]